MQKFAVLKSLYLYSVQEYYLESIVGEITGQSRVPFGDAVISTLDTCIGAETCEEVGTRNVHSIAPVI